MFGGGSGGGLFGDLPSAKKQSAAKEDRNQSEPDGGPEEAQGKRKQQTVSLVSALGKAGTSMAFMPAALRKKKAKNVNRTSSGGSSTAGGEGAVTREEIAKGTGGNKSDTDTDRAALGGEPTEAKAVAPVVATEESTGKVSGDTTSQSPTVPGEDPGLVSDNEPEALRLLHASVTDPYDPLVPNDYLAYRERKKNEALREEMAKSAREALALQQQMRERIEEERRAAERSGDVEKIVESRKLGIVEGDSMGRGRGRGRGRGVTNLPAWLVKKQKEEQEANGIAGQTIVEAASAVVNNGQFDDEAAGPSSKRSSCTVVLGNMTLPGEIDDDLAEEVREECELRCGKVSSVTVKDASPPKFPVVRVFVTFINPEDARSASTLFDGRRFGDRTISASLVSEGGTTG